MNPVYLRLIEIANDLGQPSPVPNTYFQALLSLSSGRISQIADPLSVAKVGPKGLANLAIKGYNPKWVNEGPPHNKRLSPSSDTQASSNGTESNAEDGPQLRKPALVPVVGEVKAGTDGYLEELQYPVGHGDEYAPSPVSDSSAYAVRVRGESMYPRYKSGEYVIISPSLIAQNGDDVVVIFRDGRKMLKVFGWRRGGEIQLLSINNGFAPLTVNTLELHSMHVVAGTAHRSSIQRLDNQEAEKIDIEERRAIELMKDPRVQELLRDIEQKNK